MIKFLLFLILFLSAVVSASEDETSPISVGWELWYPYQYLNEQQQLTGLDVEIFNLIAEKSHLDISYIELPWKRHLLYLKTGKIDIAMGSSKNRERQQYAHFTVPYRVEEIRLFVLKGKAKKMPLNYLADLIDSNYIIGVEGGYFYGDKYQYLSTQTNFQSHINEVIDINQNVKMLVKGYIDGFLADPVTMKAFIKTFNLHDKFEQHPLDIYHTDIHLMLSKKAVSKTQLETLNQVIADLKSSGKLKQIIQKYSVLNTDNK